MLYQSSKRPGLYFSSNSTYIWYWDHRAGKLPAMYPLPSRGNPLLDSADVLSNILVFPLIWKRRFWNKLSVSAVSLFSRRNSLLKPLLFRCVPTIHIKSKSKCTGLSSAVVLVFLVMVVSSIHHCPMETQPSISCLFFLLLASEILCYLSHFSLPLLCLLWGFFFTFNSLNMDIQDCLRFRYLYLHYFLGGYKLVIVNTIWSESISVFLIIMAAALSTVCV